MIFDYLKVGESQTKEISISNNLKKPATTATIGEPFSAVFKEIQGAFPANSTIYFDSNFCIEDENGFYTENQGNGQLGTTDENGKLTLFSSAVNFGFLYPLDNDNIDKRKALGIKIASDVNYINLYYSINSGASVAIATESTLKSFTLDLSALTLEEGDIITLSMIDFDNPSTTAEIDINIIEKTIEITDPLNDSVLKIGKNINLTWSDAHVNTFEIYTALNSEPYTLLAERTSNNFVIIPDMIEASEDDILHIKVKDKDSDIFDSIDVELKSAFVEITTPLNLSGIQLDSAFNILGNSNAQYINIYATSATATDILLAENVEIVSGEFSEMIIFSDINFEKGEPVEILIIDTADSNNYKKIYVGIYCEGGGVITNFELSMTTDSSSSTTAFLSMSSSTEYIIGDEY